MANLCKSDWDVIQISDPSKTALHWHLPRLKHRWNSFPCSSFMRNMKNPNWKWTDMNWHPITVETLEKNWDLPLPPPWPQDNRVSCVEIVMACCRSEAGSSFRNQPPKRLADSYYWSLWSEWNLQPFVKKCENAENAQAPRKNVTHHKHSTTNINIMTSRLSQQFPWKFANHPAGWEWSRKALLQYHLRPCEVYTLEILNSKYSKV